MELFEHKKRKVMLLRVSRHEALKLIESLTQQMLSGSPNKGRYEQYLDDGRDFSIAVHDTPTVGVESPYPQTWRS